MAEFAGSASDAVAALDYNSALVVTGFVPGGFGAYPFVALLPFGPVPAGVARRAVARRRRRSRGVFPDTFSGVREIRIQT